MQSKSPAPERPLFQIVLLALLARLSCDVLGAPLAALGLGVSLCGLVAGHLSVSEKQRRVASAVGSRAALFFAFLLALTVSPPPQAATTRGLDGEFDGEQVRAAEGRSVEVLHPGSLALGDRVRLEAGAALRRSARGPVRAPGAAPSKLRIVLPDEYVRLAASDSWLARAAHRVRRVLDQARSRWIRRTEKLSAESTRALVQSLVFGETSALEFEDADLFTRTGTRHLLAVSGLHVSLVLLFAIGPCSNLLLLLLPRRLSSRVRATLRDVVRLAALIGLVYLAGARAPALRAASAFAFAQAGAHVARRFSGDLGASLEVSRRADTLSVWSLALLCECFAAGAEPLSVSVRLSYGATLGLILGTNPINRSLRRALGLASRLPRSAARGAWLRIPARRLFEVFLSGCGASVAATVATLPFVWLEFGEWSPAGIIATPLVMPLFTLVLFLSWSWIALPFQWLEVALDNAIELLLQLLLLADRVPMTPLLLPARPSWWLAAWSLPLLAALLFQLGGRAQSAALRVAAIAFSLGLLPWAIEPATPELHLLDVGHGTAVCLRAPGEPTWIFDAGSRDRGRVARDALLPLLAAWEVPEVRVALSHSDRDHCSALRLLATRLPIDLWVGAPPEPSGVRLDPAVPRMDLESGAVQLPSHAASGLSLKLLRWQAISGNEGSRALFLQYRSARVLLSGDTEGEALRTLATRFAVEAPLSLLLLPHHGSDGPHFGRLLSATRPGEVWISHSRALSIEGELQRRGLPWRSTRREGPLFQRLE